MIQVLLVDPHAQTLSERLTISFPRQWEKLTPEQRMKFVKQAIDAKVRQQIESAAG